MFQAFILFLLSAHSPTFPSQLILQPFRRFTNVTALSATLPLLHLRHSSFCNPSFASPTSLALHLRHLVSCPCFKPSFCCFLLLILQLFRHFTYVTAHSPTLPSLYLRHSSFCNSSAASPTSQIILQHFRRFSYVTALSATLPLLHLCHRSFSSPYFASPTSKDLQLRHLASCPWFSLSFVTTSL